MQSHFLLSGSPSDSQWIVPITLCSGSYQNRHTILFKEKSGSLDIKETAWIKLNVDQTGFYRVKYDEELQARLRHAIESSQLSATDRFGKMDFFSMLDRVIHYWSHWLTLLFSSTGVLDDSYALCMSGQQSLTTLLTLVASFKEETEYTVLSNLISVISPSFSLSLFFLTKFSVIHDWS